MKKILLSVILILSISAIPVMSSEVEDDYFDIAANYCVFGNYNSAMEYLDKILTINPNNQRATNLKKGLAHVISGDKSSFVENVNPLIKQAMEYKRKYPVGIQNFEKLREDGFLYVDKTALIYQMVKSGS